MKKDMLDKYSIDDLIILENASRIVCMKYESASKNYDGSIINNEQYALFKKYNDFRGKVIEKIEKILDGEIGD